MTCVRQTRWLRAAGILALLLLLCAPTPGAVGSCSGSDLEESADLESYCTERDQLVCVRRSLRKELTDQERDDCRRAAIAACESRFWAPQCEPTRRQARACLNALRSFDTLHTPEDEIAECSLSTLCGISVPDPGTPGAAGTGAEPVPIEADAGAEGEDN